MSKPSVFISYSHKDEEWKDLLLNHMEAFYLEGLLEVWHDRQIGAGDAWYTAIHEAIDNASVAVLLVSEDFLASEFILTEEVPRLLRLRDEKGLRLFPIIVTPCDWGAVDWLSPLQLRPKARLPLSRGKKSDIDADTTAIAKEIGLLLSGEIQRSTAENWQTAPPAEVAIARLPISSEHLFGRELELALLDAAWADENTNMLSLLAWGGVGKTALLKRWLDGMGRDYFRGAERVFAWSFHSQGSRDSAASADQFIATTLRWFGDPNPTEGSPPEKGERLARLIRQQRTLLLLDGLEALQSPPGPDAGRIKDPALSTMVRELAAANPGLVVITTRQRVVDIDHHTRSITRAIELAPLTDADGAELLRALEVQGPDEELQKASREFRGHSLALNLLGTYLRDVCEGDVRRRDEVSLLEEDEEQGGQARRVMVSYEKWFGAGPELAVLHVLGMYDRPAEGESVAALRAAPVIKGLTEALFHTERKSGLAGLLGQSDPTSLTGSEWRRTLARLRKAGLLAKADPASPETLDAHPLVREHFGRLLQTESVRAWQGGNKRLYEHFTQVAPPRPDTVEEMAPLYAAVAHGCAANLHRRVLREVFLLRIRRVNVAYSWKTLGLFGEDLAALSCFFDELWDKPSQVLSKRRQGFVVSEAGFCLRALGRLDEARQPMEVALENAIAMKNNREASIRAANLSEIHVILGNLHDARRYAEQSVSLADQARRLRSRATSDMLLIQRSASRVVLGIAAYHNGDREGAELLFREAEERVRGRFLVPGNAIFFQCEIMLDGGRVEEALERSRLFLDQTTRADAGLMSAALAHLSVGRAMLRAATNADIQMLNDANVHFDQAVQGLRQSPQEFVPYGLLSRSALHRAKGLFEPAWRDQKEARAIAERGGMRLHQVEAHLEAARLCLAENKRNEAIESLATAKEMSAEMGYHRADMALVDL